MIWESGPWRDELRSYGNRLGQLMRDGISTNEDEWALEQAVMIGAFIVRKLIETPMKVPDSIVEQRFDLAGYLASSGSLIQPMNWHHLEQHFDFSKASARTVDTTELCNQIIHSFVFAMHFEDDPQVVTGVLVSSDRKKADFLYVVPISSIRQLFSDVAENPATSISYEVDGDAFQLGPVLGPIDGSS